MKASFLGLESLAANQDGLHGAMKQGCILGVRFWLIKRNEIIDLLIKFAHGDVKRNAFYINAHCLNTACDDPRYRRILNSADLVYVGGTGVLMACRFLGIALCERTNILDFFDDFVVELKRLKTKVYLLGNTAEVVAKAAGRLKGLGVEIVGCHHGYFGEHEQAGVIEEINRAKPDMLIVGLGMPKQEKWIDAHRQELQVSLCWGVGAAFDWISGYRQRAPRWMRVSCLEWLHRLWQQPWRLARRYTLGNSVFVLRILVIKLKQVVDEGACSISAFFKQHMSYGFKNFLKYVRLRFFNMFSTVVIETMTTCNRSCSFCPNSFSGRGLAANEKRMDEALFHKIIDELAALKWVGGITLNAFNEPLLDARLPDWIRHVRKRLPACPVNIFSNGDFLTLELYQALVGAGLTTLFVTQYDPEGMKNVAGIKEYRKIHGAQGVGLVHEKSILLSNRGGLIDLPKNARTYKRCYVRIGRVHINYDGDVFLCCQDYFNTIKLGNLRHECLADVWNKAYFRRLREEIVRHVYSLQICKTCATTLKPLEYGKVLLDD